MTSPTETTRTACDPSHGTVEQWYVEAGGRTEGPLSADEMRVRAATGLLRPADRVSPDCRTWVSAETVPGLAFPPTTVVIAPNAPRPVRPLVETVAADPTRLTDSAEASGFTPLDSVPGYELQGILGNGACGVVFRAVQKKLNRVVALKTVLMAQNTPADVLARFDQEAVSLARLQHPNIVTVYDCGHSAGQAFFAMELLAGEDLAQRITRDGPLDERLAWLIARQTAAALDHAARHGVIHRDVKPANLFLVPPPTGFPLPAGVPMVKVTDFGLALTLRGPDEADLTETAAGVFLGTPVYMAPEQFQGAVDLRADIYSLGATVYHVLSGVVPFDGRTIPQVMRQKGDPAPRLSAPVSEETADLVAAMMALDARDRPADYDDLIARIDALPCLAGAFTAAGLPIAAPPPALVAEPSAGPAPKRKRWAFALGAAVLLGAAVGAAALAGAFNRTPANRLGDQPPKPPATFVAGAQQALYDGQGVLPWSGRNVTLEQDQEKKNVLSAWGVLSRKLPPAPNFRVTLALDPRDATSVELILATGAGPPDSAPQWLVKVDHATGAAFGTRAGPEGAFERVGAVVPVPAPNARTEEGLPPYLELLYERAGGALSASFNHKPLGRAPDAGLHTPEVRLVTVGAIRIESAVFEELVEQK